MGTAVQPAPQPPVPPKRIETARRGSRFEVAIVTILVLTLIAFSGAYAAQATTAYLLVLAGFAIYCIFLGRWISGRPFGILIGDRNLMSMSRFQMVLWTILVISAYLTMCLRRVHTGEADPLAITMDWHLWALMGISTASLIGSPLLLGNKAQKAPEENAAKRAAVQLREDATDIKQNSCGLLYANTSIMDASFADMFQGDEIGNTAYIDLAKVQMFFFTFVSLVVYGAALYHMFKGGNFAEMPKVSDGLIALLGISHAGYLTSKTAESTPRSSELQIR